MLALKVTFHVCFIQTFLLHTAVISFKMYSSVDVTSRPNSSWSYKETVQLITLIIQEDCLNGILAGGKRSVEIFKMLSQKLFSGKSYRSCEWRFKLLKLRFRSEQLLQQKKGQY